MYIQPAPREQNLARILRVLRDNGPTTRPDLERLTGLGRRIVADRVQELVETDLVSEGSFAPSTGGRMPRQIRFQRTRGVVGVAEMNVHFVSVGLSDLAGNLLAVREIASDVIAGPNAACETIASAICELAHEAGQSVDRLWGVGVGVTAPVNPATGGIVSGQLFDRTSMKGWDGFPVRDRLSELLGRPVWVGNEVNLMALGEARAGLGRGHSNVLFAKLGPGFGGGLVMGGVLQQDPATGEIGHLRVPNEVQRLCWCGRRGCLFSFVEEKVLLAEYAGIAIDSDQPPTLLSVGGDDRAALTALVQSAAAGEPRASAVLIRAGERIGSVLAEVVTLIGPSLVLLGGALVAGDTQVAAVVRRVIKEQAMPLAQDDLAVEVSPLSDRAGLVGAAFLAADALLSPESLAIWLDDGSPVNHAIELHAAQADAPRH